MTALIIAVVWIVLICVFLLWWDTTIRNRNERG